MKKINTKNDNIKVSNSLYISCTKGKGIKLYPIYIQRNSTDDILYYKIELVERDNTTDTWHIVNSGVWNIYPNSIEDLFNYISQTTKLKTRETVAVLEEETDQISFINSIMKNGTLSRLIGEKKIDINEFTFLKNTIRIFEIEDAITKFEKLLEISDAEKDFEDWCAENYWVFGNYYVATDKIHQISNAERVDCLIKNVINQYRDIIEFKKPSFDVLCYDTGHQNYYFSAEVSKAISQVINYSDIFTLEAHNGLHRHEEIVSYYPQSIIVIGRSIDFNAEQIKAMHALNSRLNGICVKTYDDLLAQAKALLATIKPIDEVLETDLDDDIPF
ncbi:MAG: DUF4263 domain-containing protein [Roseburia sp.]|nr:DUF4263 domain-containing protein [Roseburia sp.]